MKINFTFLNECITFFLAGVYGVYAQTSVMSSLARFCLGCSSSGAYIINFLENNKMMVSKTQEKDAV